MQQSLLFGNLALLKIPQRWRGGFWRGLLLNWRRLTRHFILLINYDPRPINNLNFLGLVWSRAPMNGERHKCDDCKNCAFDDRLVGTEEILRLREVNTRVVISSFGVEAFEILPELLIAGFRSRTVFRVPFTKLIAISPPLKSQGHCFIHVSMIGARKKVHCSHKKPGAADYSKVEHETENTGLDPERLKHHAK